MLHYAFSSNHTMYRAYSLSVNKAPELRDHFTCSRGDFFWRNHYPLSLYSETYLVLYSRFKVST